MIVFATDIAGKSFLSVLNDSLKPGQVGIKAKLL